jgi:glycosyltransferase involved in cell wall biosynthesis
MESLVSIIVITYNSAKYVCDTLESAKRQTYPNIELIITDDCSTDHTVQVCTRWIEENKDRFVRVEIIANPTNTGVAANCNRGLYAARGEWIKFMAGDDMMLDHCVSDNMAFISGKSNYFIFSYPRVLVEPNDDVLKAERESFFRNCSSFFALNSRFQFLFLLINPLIMNPATLFCHRAALINLKGFDERYSCEDLPLYLEATKSGHSLRLLEKETVIYRMHTDSLSYQGQAGLINQYWFKEKAKIIRQYLTLPFLLRHPLVGFDFYVQYVSKNIVIWLGNKIKVGESSLCVFYPP